VPEGRTSVDAESVAIATSLGLLAAALTVLSVRGFVSFYRKRSTAQMAWGVGLGFGAAAMAVELAAFVGIVSSPLLQLYVFLSAAIVGVLSLGSARAFRGPWFGRVYSVYTVAACGVVAVFSFTTPMPDSMVTQGIVTGNPPLLLLVLSSFVTVPATVVLLTAAVLSLKRSFRWRGLLMVAGASVLGAGGAFYIASFPVMLYYAEFVGILMLFIGLVDLSKLSISSPLARPHEKAA
jgi:hypothetical protein